MSKSRLCHVNTDCSGRAQPWWRRRQTTQPRTEQYTGHSQQSARCCLVDQHHSHTVTRQRLQQSDSHAYEHSQTDRRPSATSSWQANAATLAAVERIPGRDALATPVLRERLFSSPACSVYRRTALNCQPAAVTWIMSPVYDADWSLVAQA